VAGAQALGLHHHRRVGRGGALQRFHAGAGHHHGALEARRLAGGEQVVQHRTTGDRVQRLRQGGPHPRPHAGCQDYRDS
jgi:hypothetical protein